MTFDEAVVALRLYLQSLELYGPPPSVYISSRPLKPSELRKEYDTAPLGLTPDKDGSWIGFIDLYPSHGWPHGCVYVLIHSDGEASGEDSEFYPEDWSKNFIPVFKIHS